MKQMIFPLLLLFTAATSSFAQLTPKRQAIQAAIYGSEPEYIRDALLNLNQSLSHFIAAQNIKSSTQRIALYEAIQAVLWFAFCEVSQGAKTAAREHLNGYHADVAVESIAYSSGWGTALIALNRHIGPVSDTLLVVVEERMHEIMRRCAQENAFGAVFDYRETREVAAIAYRVAEFAGLELLVENFVDVLFPSYQYSLLLMQTRKHHKIDESVVDRLRQMPEDARVFLATCLRHFGQVKRIALPKTQPFFLECLPDFQTCYPFLGHN